MRFLRQSMIGLLLAAMTLGLLFFAAHLIVGALQDRLAGQHKAPPARERVFSVNVIRAEAGDQTPVLETFGEIQSRTRLELRAAGSGRVIALADSFEEGGRVRAGDVLIRLDTAEAEAEVARLTNDLADAKAEQRDAARSVELTLDELTAAEQQLALRDRALERQRNLGQQGVVTATVLESTEIAATSARQAVLSLRQALAQSEARVDQAATRLARSNIALEQAKRRLADTQIMAPFDGTLTSTNVVEGRLVSANERLAELIDPDDLEVSFRVSTAQYARLLDKDGSLIGADVVARLDVSGLDIQATGRVSRVSAAAGEGATGRVIFATLGSVTGFKAGDFVTVRVQEPVLENVVRLPSSAVDAKNTLLVLDGDNRLETVPVDLLRRQGDEVLVRGDLEGRLVVAMRSPLLGAGIAVKPLGAEQDAARQAQEMLELTEERRAHLVALVNDNRRMPNEAKKRVLARLAQPSVPAQLVERIENGSGG